MSSAHLSLYSPKAILLLIRKHPVNIHDNQQPFSVVIDAGDKLLAKHGSSLLSACKQRLTSHGNYRFH